jgi:hypothetical protein
MRNPFAAARTSRMPDSVTLAATASRDAVTVDYKWLADAGRDAPVAVFLPEAGPPAEAPDDWPVALARALGCRGLILSRPDGRRPAAWHGHPHAWPIERLRQQACDILPALLDVLDIDSASRRRMWIAGALDGATVALLYAIANPYALAGAVLIAPQVFAEPARTEDLLGTRAAFETTNLAKRLAPRLHDEARSTPAAPSSPVNWNIEGELAAIRCPLLALPASASDDDARHLDALRLHATRAGPLSIEPAPADKDALIGTIVRFVFASPLYLKIR